MLTGFCGLTQKRRGSIRGNAFEEIPSNQSTNMLHLGPMQINNTCLEMVLDVPNTLPALITDKAMHQFDGGSNETFLQAQIY